jgi:hypothetical protein
MNSLITVFRLSIYICIIVLPVSAFAQYIGTASVTQGKATTTVNNLYTCTGGRVAGIGTITATDKTVWTVPAVVNFTNNSFPFASDLNNPCNGANYPTAAAALAKLNGSDIVTVDADGELITAFVFADNYFEMYINGIPVGKDNVPYTQFNSNIVRFTVKRPFTIVMKLVDWEENLGLGSEANGGSQYHNGDGGMVAVFYDSNNTIIAATGKEWKAQTFYTAPITDLSCPTEKGALRLSDKCSTKDSPDGSMYYALHWAVPLGWMNADFDDSQWAAASTYTNATVGVDNKPAYTNFTSIFNDPTNDAQFIWSTNLILDNEVIVRHTVTASSSVEEEASLNDDVYLYPNPATKQNHVRIIGKHSVDIQTITVINVYGQTVYSSNEATDRVDVEGLPVGIYGVQIQYPAFMVTKKLIIQ